VSRGIDPEKLVPRHFLSLWRTARAFPTPVDDANVLGALRFQSASE
jgi:hypothetical protein